MSTEEEHRTVRSGPSPDIFNTTGDAAEHEKCTSLVESAMRSCPKIRFMRAALAKLGRHDAADVRCAHCPEGAAAAGGYIPDRQLVVLCQQWVARAPNEVENTIVHEMVHAYDDARAFFDWNDLTQHACTEIRAANLSGDCSFTREFDRGKVSPLSLSGAGARCVRRRAELSVAMHPGCADPAMARRAVERAWSTCFADRAPFDEHPRSKMDV
jgi:inner membrane protease ATP23